MRARSLVSVPIAAAMLVVLAAPGVAAATPPMLSVQLSPMSPDGSSGWYRTDPEAFAFADQGAVLHFDWGSGEETAALASGIPVSLGFAPEGMASLATFAVNGGDESSVATTLTIKTDTQPPSQPSGLHATPSPGHVALSWDAVSDATSGLGRYTVYRNLTGPPFSVGDAIASVSTTSFTDAPGGSGTWYYGVRATDAAGNDSLMSDAVHASADVSPPSVPCDVGAWRNGRGFIRVSWAASADAGTGVAYYTISRSVGGAGEIVLGTVPSGATFFDDPDAEAYAAADVAYTVSASDWAGNASAESTPAEAGTDLTPPVQPPAPSVIPIPDLGGMFHKLGTDVEVTWDERHDAGSGILRYELMYGPDPASPSTVTCFPLAGSTFVRSSAERSDWFFAMRVEDRAGNISEVSDAKEQRAVTVDRIDGPDRIRTSLAVARAGFSSAHAAVFASACSFPDALAASGLAGALHAPVILVGPGALPADTVAALNDLGVQDGWVVGGPPAVSSATYSSIGAAMSGETTRVAGLDRYRTASAVASAVVGLAGRPARVFLVSGVAFPDALSVGPAAYVGASPVLFATPSSLPQTTQDSLRAVAAPKTVIVGGYPAIWSGADARVAGPKRISGKDRYATSEAFAEWALGEKLLTADRPLLVTGANFPDGLSAAPLAGGRTSPVLLVRIDGLDRAATFLGGHLGETKSISAIGSDAAITYGVMFDAWKMFTL
jgi:putative cell wall-binding protein